MFEQKKLDLVCRPTRNKNNVPKKIQLYTNIYDIIADNIPGCYLYSVKVYTNTLDKQIISHDSRKLRRFIIQSAQKQIEQKIGKYLLRGNILQAFQQSLDIISIETEYEDVEYLVDIDLVKERSIDLKDTSQQGYGNKVTQAFNNFVKQAFLNIKFEEKGKQSKFFDPTSFDNNHIKEYGLKIGRGFLSSTQIQENDRIALLFDPCSKIQRTQTAYDFIYQECKKNQDAVKAGIVGFSVMATYANHRNYIVKDVDFKKTPKSTFNIDGKEISYANYYKEQYKVQIKDLSQCLLVSESKFNNDGKMEIQTIYLIPELVHMTGLPSALVADFRAMQAVAKYTKMDPEERLKLISGISQQLKKELQTFGIKIDTSKPPQVEGYQLNKPTITIGRNNTIDLSRNENFFIKGQVLVPQHLQKNRWVVIYFEQNNRELNAFLDTLLGQCKKYGINIGEPVCLDMKKNSTFQDWEDELLGEINEGIDICVSILPNSSHSFHAKLKQLFYNNVGVIQQNIVAKTLSNPKKLSSIVDNICLQMNAKLGGTLYQVEKPKTLNPKTMLVGIDVYHHTKNNSFVGFVASYDSKFSKYNAQVCQQKFGKDKEFLANFGQLLKNSLVNFYQSTKSAFLPECIVVFRDGVGDSQVNIVKEQEYNQLLEILKDEEIVKINKGKPYQPELAFIIVNKKINTKFFAQSKQGAQNPNSGTLVQSKITKDVFDFFLANQKVTQGTCTPTYYQVICNSTKMDEFDFYNLCYWQSYNYFNWKGPVRVPAPIQYAHKLAYMTGDVTKKSPNQKIQNSLYYL